MDPTVIDSPNQHLNEGTVPIVADNIRVLGSDENVHAEEFTTGNRNRSMINVVSGGYLKDGPSYSASATKKSTSSDKSSQKKASTRVREDQSLAEAEDEGSLVVYDEGPVLGRCHSCLLKKFMSKNT